MKTVKVGVVLAAVLFVTMLVLTGWALGALHTRSAGAVGSDQGTGRYGQEGLRVSGTAVVRAAPDLALVRLGYESRNRRARESKVANDAVMRKVTAALEREGVARKDIQTVEYRVFPVYENWPTPTTRTLFWHVVHMVEVRVHKVDTVTEVIDAASEAGADKVDNVEFKVDSLHTLRAEARKMAAKVAREKAEQLAGLMNTRLGKVVAVVDSSTRTSMPPWARYGAAANIAAQATADLPSGDASPDSIVSAGQVVVEATEEVVYALR